MNFLNGDLTARVIKYNKDATKNVIKTFLVAKCEALTWIGKMENIKADKYAALLENFSAAKYIGIIVKVEIITAKILETSNSFGINCNGRP